jgi:hypothetical protein
LYKHHPHSGLKRALKHLKGTTHEQRILVAFASDLP